MLHSGSRKPVRDVVHGSAACPSKAVDSHDGTRGTRAMSSAPAHAALGWRSATTNEALSRRLLPARGGGSWGHVGSWNWWQKPEAASVARWLKLKASSCDIIVIHDGDHNQPRKDFERTRWAWCACCFRDRALVVTCSPCCASRVGNRSGPSCLLTLSRGAAHGAQGAGESSSSPSTACGRGGALALSRDTRSSSFCFGEFRRRVSF